MVESRLTMSPQLQSEKLARLSAHLDDLFLRLSCRGPDALAPELADEIAATAGEVTVELAAHREDELVRQVIEDARGLRKAVRTVYPELARVAESGRALISDLGSSSAQTSAPPERTSTGGTSYTFPYVA